MLRETNFLATLARVLHVGMREDQSFRAFSALSRNKNFLLCNHFFLQKDVAESVEARKVTPSF